MPQYSGLRVKRLSTAKKWLGGLDAEAAASLITTASDVTLVVDPGERAVIAEVSFGSADLEGDLKAEALLGQPWAETVTVESRGKVAELLRDARSGSAPRWRHVNHVLPGGQELPILYAALKVDARGRVVAMGRSMRPLANMQQRLIEAQRSMEREYSRLRQAETRHRLLFQVSAEAVIIVDAGNSKVVEANPAAMQLLGDAGRRLVGRPLREAFDTGSRRTLEGLFSKLDAAGHADDYPLRPLADSARPLRMSGSLFREGRASYYLVRLLPADRDADTLAVQKKKSRVFELVESSPDGFVVTDMKGRIAYANRAFLDLVQLASEEQVLNEPLDRWLGRPGVDFSLLANQLREHNNLKLFATALRGEYGSAADVEICAVAVPEGGEPYCGFSIRDVSNRLAVDRRVSADRPRSVEQLTELVGRVPLRELVRESTDMIERLCIEAALELTGDNRASAAEILGLSRQGLYAKLHRHGIAEIGGAGGSSAGH